MAAERTSGQGLGLHPDHPIARGCIIFGMKRPGSSEKPSTPEPASQSAPSTNQPDQYQVAASNVYEQALTRLGRGTAQPHAEPYPSSESTTPDCPETTPLEKSQTDEK